MLHTINNFVHVGIGTVGLLGGAIALLAVKGSRWGYEPFYICRNRCR